MTKPLKDPARAVWQDKLSGQLLLQAKKSGRKGTCAFSSFTFLSKLVLRALIIS